VRSAEDIKDVHRIMDEEGIRVPVIAKIEKPQAVENLVGIVDAFDGIMVARGDLGSSYRLKMCRWFKSVVSNLHAMPQNLSSSLRRCLIQ
jgi:2-keto-3-deoxy-L-rhamnonate aldolase RhmA